MPDDELEPWESVKYARDDHAEQVHPGLDAEPEDRTVQAGLEHRADQPPGRRVRVQVDRGVERLGRLEDGPELRIVQVLVVSVRVNDYAVEAEAPGAALDLRDRARGILRRDRGEAGEPAGVPAARLGQLGVGHRRPGRPAGGAEDLRAR